MLKFVRSSQKFFVCSVLMGFLAMNCSLREGGEPSNTQTLAEKVAGLAPEGWKLYDKVRRFTPKNLYEKIDGRAEFYLAYDMVEMTFAGFESSRDAGRFVDISIFDMGTPERAFGVFSAERSQGSDPLKLGRDAYRNGSNYFIWKGRYYIQVISSDDAEDLRRLGMNLAQTVANLVSDSGGSVWGLEALPVENRVPGSERYFLVDAMGLDFMQNTYMAEYQLGETTYSVFLSPCGSQDKAEKVVTRWLDHARHYAKGVKRLTVEGLDLVCCDMGGNYDVFFQRDGLVAGVSSVASRQTAIEASIDLWKKLSKRREAD